MKTYTFTCARRNESGVLGEIPNLITPPVTCSTPTEAIHHADVKQFCTDNNCVVYRVVK